MPSKDKNLKEDKGHKGNPVKNPPKPENPSILVSPSHDKKHHKKIKVLFILKDRAGYGYIGPSFGLSCSCNFICNALREHGIECDIAIVTDGNDVERVVFKYKPTHVIGEAYWIPSEKFKILCPRYKNIFWTVRSHSKIPFFQGESICIQYTKEYDEIARMNSNFSLSSNTYGFITPIEKSLEIFVDYLPNIYKPNDYQLSDWSSHDKRIYSVGLFGAIRLQKNLLLQALASINFAESQNKKLKLYINSNRVERGEPVLKNLEQLFKDNPNHQLIKINWLDHPNFTQLVKTMDLMMCVSDSESFSIICADGAFNNIPTIGSPEIEWMSSFYQAQPHNFDDILAKMKFADFMKIFNFQKVNRNGLLKHNKMALDVWMDWLKNTLIN